MGRRGGRSPWPRSVTAYVGATVLAAAAALAALIASGPVARIDGRWFELVTFALLICVCEVKPITVSRGSGVQEIVASATFSFAVFLMFGPLPAIVAQSVASAVSDTYGRKGVFKAAFNIAQYMLAWAIAGMVFRLALGRHALDPGLQFTSRWALAVVATGAVYFLCNNIVVGLIISISAGTPAVPTLLTIIRREATSGTVLLALTSIVVVATNQSLVLLPVLLLPVIAVYRSALLSAEKEHQALHDGLTDLPNRLQFSTIMKRRFEHGKSRSAPTAVLLIDLDRFKEINDTLGHQAGDDLLRQIGPRIKQALPADGVIARLGGDEFAVMLPDVDGDGALRIGEHIVHTLQAPFRLDGFNLEVEASIGVALFPAHGTDPEELIKQADIAMYFAKGRNSGVEMYHVEHDHHSHRRLSLLSELRTALGRDEVALYYQPKLDLRTGGITGFEALIRWHHPTFGLIPPADFVPFAEHTGLIKPLTNFVLRTAVAQACVWLEGGARIPVAVNLSARVLHDGSIAAEIERLLEEFALPAECLQLEITESSIMADPARAKRVLELLDSMGVKLAIDDFGTGYSSLAYLQGLPVGEVKIDRSFVMRVVDSPRDRVIVRSTIDLTRHLGLSSTAEGIEDEESLEWLRSAGCDQGQGYHIAQPMPVDEATRWYEAATGTRLAIRHDEPAEAERPPTRQPQHSLPTSAAH